jgi:hypothetical protein
VGPVFPQGQQAADRSQTKIGIPPTPKARPKDDDGHTPVDPYRAPPHGESNTGGTECESQRYGDPWQQKGSQGHDPPRGTQWQEHAPLCKHPEWPSNAEYRTSTICLRRQSETVWVHRGGRHRGWQQRARVPDESLQPPRRQGPPSHHRVEVSASPACAGKHQRQTERHGEGGRLKWNSPLIPGADEVAHM